MTAPMSVADTMDALAAAASSVATAHAYPKDDVTSPCIIVGYPSEFDFDVTFVVGNAKAVYPLWYVVGKVIEKSTRDKIDAAVLALKTALEAASLVIRVVRAVFETVTIASVAYMTVRLDCEVIS